MVPFDHSCNELYQKALNFAQIIFAKTDSFGTNALEAEINQLRSAAFSISMFIAEGSVRKSLKDKSRMFSTARGSLHQKCLPLLQKAMNAGCFDFETLDLLKRDAVEMDRLLGGLIEGNA